MRSQRTTKRLDVNGVGLLPSAQGRGANVMLYTKLWKAAQPYGFRMAEAAQIDEHNAKSRGDM